RIVYGLHRSDFPLRLVVRPAEAAMCADACFDRLAMQRRGLLVQRVEPALTRELDDHLLGSLDGRVLAHFFVSPDAPYCRAGAPACAGPQRQMSTPAAFP